MEEFNNGRNKKKLITKRIIIVSSIVLLLLGSNLFFFYLGNEFAFNGIVVKSVSAEATKDLKEIKDVKKYSLLFEVREALIAKYDGEIEDEKLLEGAIKGMTSSLKDPYTVYMNGEEYTDFMDQSEGHFVGIGAQIGIKDDKIIIIAPIEGSPAEEAGVKAGDVVLKVDDVEVEPNVDKVISRIRGEEGKAVKLTLQRDNGAAFDVEIVRGVVKTIAVKGELVDGNIGYIQLSAFDEDVAKDLEAKINELKSQGMQGMVLDLRGNPGGYLGEAVRVASQFIPKGDLVTYTVDKYDQKVESKSMGGVAQGMPLVVLIDGGSASASEVVTGALRDYKVATIVGETSFGKGVVQQLVNFDNNQGGLKVTTSKYYTPNGENIHKIGIKPDIEVKISEELLKEPYNRGTDPQYLKALEVIKGKL